MSSKDNAAFAQNLKKFCYANSRLKPESEPIFLSIDKKPVSAV
jgi:hypothetical protein